MKPRKYWTATEDAQLIALYPNTPTEKLASQLGHSLSSTYQRAYKLGLAKSAEYLATPASGRTNGRQGIGTRFEKGHAPANKGLRRPGWGPGRMKETQFRAGERRGRAAARYKLIGTERISKEGYLERKINNDLPFQRRWRFVHLIVWEAEHGPLPTGHAIAFRDGDRSNTNLDNLECITRRELMLRNSVHNLPAPLPQVVQLLGALNRKINRRKSHEEQNRGSAQPPVRNTGSAERSGQTDGPRASEGDRGCWSCDRGLGEGGSGVHDGNRQARGDGLYHAPRRAARITATARIGHGGKRALVRRDRVAVAA